MTLASQRAMVENKNKNRSYFSVGRGKAKKKLVIIIPIIVAIIAVVFIISSVSPGPISSSNKMVLHNHAILNVTYIGQVLTVPAHIGMVTVGKSVDPMSYGDHSLDKYGMEGMSPLHTHDASGQIHVESNTNRDFKFGEFLDIWRGLDLNGKMVQATENGIPVSDYRDIVLNDGVSIGLNVS